MAVEGMELLRRKRALIEEILRITEDAVLSGDPNNLDVEAEIYSGLYEKRENLVRELLSAQEAVLRAEEANELAKTPEADVIKTDTEELLKRLIALDKRNKAIGKVLLDSVKKNIKKINQGRNASRLYNNLSASDGYMVNKEN